jgi:hypothetical protein
MKRNTILTVVALAVALLLPVVATAQVAAVETAEGTVVSINGTTLVLKTSTGNQTYMLASPQQLVIGAPVSVKFSRSGDRLMVSSLVPGPAAPATPAATNTAASTLTNNRDDKVVGDGEDDNVTGLDRDAARDGTDPGQSAVPATGTMNNNRDDKVLLDGDDDNVTGLDQDATRDDNRLPGTASPLALLALLGGAAVAGATALRMKR